jgi:Protein of unknown function (DUF2939)
MRFLFRLLFLAILAGVGFYVVWPAFSGYQLYTALAQQDASRLASKIDFDSVRSGLRPVVTSEVERQLGQNAGGNLPPQLRQQLVPQLVEATLKTVVTPENMMRIYAEGGDVRRSVTNILREKMAAGGSLPGGLGGALGPVPGLGGGGDGARGALGGLGGLSGLGDAAGRLGMSGSKAETAPPTPATATPAPAAGKSADKPPAFGFGNIKQFGLAGPLGLQIGVAQNAQAADADVTARMEFRDFDWKLTQVVPRL